MVEDLLELNLKQVMKTAGNLIRARRAELNLTRNELGEMTHIKTSFIKAIEESDWSNLPELAVTIGFLKSISHFLDIDDTQVVALFRREYNPNLKTEKQRVKTKEITKKFIWGPRLTFIALVILILSFVMGYLGFQYNKFNSPPKLIINEPKETQVKKGELKVSGITDHDATIEVNSQRVLVNEDGTFSTLIEVNENSKEITITAKTRSGKVSLVSRTIEVKP